MAYGPLDTTTSVSDAAGNTAQGSYSSSGNLLSITYPDGSSQSLSYDPLGNLTDTVLQNGDAIDYQYTAQRLLSKLTFADKTSQSFIYRAPWAQGTIGRRDFGPRQGVRPAAGGRPLERHAGRIGSPSLAARRRA
ncbi:MAG TPA: RHS repeat protein, partial [Pirellulales bacterium]|nr:RHS repeat protein [Pirellulales bacterium]